MLERMSSLRIARRLVAISALAAMVGALPHAARAQAARAMADTGRTQVFTGRFVTLDRANPHAEAIAVRGGRIVAVGPAADLLAAAGPAAKHTVLPGVALPGFADAHVHAAGLGEVLDAVELRGLSKAALLERVRAAALKAAPGAWIRGSGWDQSFWTPPEFPTAAELDKVSNGHPVVLERIDGHAIWVNTPVLARAKVTRATAEVAGGRIVRDAVGAPTGVFVDEAMALIHRAEPALPATERVRRLRAALAQYARWGYTEVHDAGIGLADIAAYRAIGAGGPLPVRVYAMASAADSTLRTVLAQGPVMGELGGTFTLRTIKVVEDGALGSRGARLGAPYADDSTRTGFRLVSAARLDTIIALARARGFQVAVHAIGDASNHDVLDAFQRAGPSARNARFRLEHASMIRDDDLPRLARLGVIASMQPVFVGEYARFAEARVGAARLPWVYRTRDVQDAGAVVASGTDYPASDTGDPIRTLVALVTRQGADGTPAAGWLPKQAVSVDAALRSMTMGPAYAAFEEQEGGMLRVGRRADFTVLSGDPVSTPASELHRLRVLRTIVGGRTTFSAP
jgi:predicted amidohydrolase YtcJ